MAELFCIEASAKTGENVKEIFTRLACALLEQKRAKREHESPNASFFLSNIFRSNPTHLDLCAVEIDAAAAEILVRELKKDTFSLFSLNLSEQKEIGQKGFLSISRVLKKNTSLTVLKLRRCELGSERFLQSLPIDNRVDSPIPSCWVNQIICNVLQNESLRVLELERNHLDEEAGDLIGELIKSHLSLTQLDLSSNMLEGRGGQTIARALRTNTSLTDLNLSWCQLDPMPFLSALSTSLRHHHSSSGLSSLVLVGINLGGGSGAVPHLRDILTHCTSLLSLDLSNNFFIDEEGEEIFSSFDTRKSGNSLRRLSILSNTRYDGCFGEKTARAVAQLLLHNTSLTSLHVDGLFAPEAVIDIEVALQYNSSLTDLLLSPRYTHLEFCALTFRNRENMLKKSQLLFSLLWGSDVIVNSVRNAALNQ